MTRRLNKHERQALATAERLVEERPGCQLAFVVMAPSADDVTHCELVPHCDVAGLVTAGFYMLATARRRLDPASDSYGTDLRRLDAALAEFPASAEFVPEARH